MFVVLDDEQNKIANDDASSSLVPDLLSSDIFCIFSRFIFFVRPEGEARWSAETCLFPHVAAFWGGRAKSDRSVSLSCFAVGISERNPNAERTQESGP